MFQSFSNRNQIYFHLFNSLIIIILFEIEVDSLAKMIIKFAKVQIKDKNKQGYSIKIQAECNHTRYSIKSQRKIKQRVSNFFGQSLYFPLSIHPINLIVSQINQKKEKKQVFKTSFKASELNKIQKGYGDMVSESLHMKLYWSWQIQTLDSHISSEFSRDLMNFQIFKQEDENESMLGQHSEKNQYGSRRIILQYEDSKSERLKTTTKNRFSQLSQAKDKFEIQEIKSKSVITMSKTPTKTNELKKSMPIKNTEKNETKKQNLNKSINTLSIKYSKQKQVRPIFHRRNSLNLHKYGAALASTVGVFAGILAGMAASY